MRAARFFVCVCGCIPLLSKPATVGELVCEKELALGKIVAAIDYRDWLSLGEECFLPVAITAHCVFVEIFVGAARLISRTHY